MRPSGEFQLKFAIWLEDYPMSRFYPGAGSVVFHRWLPDGERDALVLPIQWRGELKVWFQRFGYQDDAGFIKYDIQREELDDAMIRRNAAAFSGPLFGRLTLATIDAGDLERLRKGTDLYEEHQRAEKLPGKVDYYEDFGDRVARLLGPPLTSFFNLIRYNYGQYWVREFLGWDSRDQDVGYFFQALMAKWFDETSATWRPFRPTISPHVIHLEGLDWTQFLSKEDWASISDTARRGHEPDPAMIILSRANRFLQQEEVATSLVESITSLEIAIERFVPRRLGRSGITEFNEFGDYRIGPKLKVVLAILDPPVDPGDAARALEAIRQRNEFVHAGILPPDSAKANVRSVLAVVARLLDPPGPKFPRQPLLGSRLLYPP